MGKDFRCYISITKCLSDIRIRLLISPEHHFEDPCKHHEESTLVSQRTNARRVRSSCHNFTKENTDKGREFKFNCKT